MLAGIRDLHTNSVKNQLKDENCFAAVIMRKVKLSDESFLVIFRKMFFLFITPFDRKSC